MHDLIAEVSSLFALAGSRRDRVGAILFDDDVRSMIPPRLGWRHGLRIVREVLGSAPAGHGTAVARALRSAGRLLHRRGVVVLIVDRAADLPRRELVALAGRHDVVVVRVGDVLLQKGRSGTAIPVIDAETGRRGVLSGAPKRSVIKTIPGVDVVELSTDKDYLPAVQNMLETRERRRVR